MPSCWPKKNNISLKGATRTLLIVKLHCGSPYSRRCRFHECNHRQRAGLVHCRVAPLDTEEILWPHMQAGRRRRSCDSRAASTTVRPLLDFLHDKFTRGVRGPRAQALSAQQLICSIPYQFRRPAIRAVDAGGHPRQCEAGFWPAARVSRRRYTVLFPWFMTGALTATCRAKQDLASLLLDTTPQVALNACRSLLPRHHRRWLRQRWTSASGCADGISYFHIRFGPLPSAQGRVAQTPRTCHPMSCIHSPSLAGLLNCLNHHLPPRLPSSLLPSPPPPTHHPPTPHTHPPPPHHHLHHHLHHHHSTLKNRWTHHSPTVRRHLRTGIPVFRHHFRTRRR